MNFHRYISENELYSSGFNHGNPYYWNPYEVDYRQVPSYSEEREQSKWGQATWTEGGATTKCGIPWSQNEYMTVAVGENTSYACGQVIKVSNPHTGREIHVTVVDEVRGYPENRINLHRHAFEALGANLNVGVLDVQIESDGNLDQEGQFRQRLQQVVQAAYPNASVRGSEAVDTTETEAGNIRERYDFIVEVADQRRAVRGEVEYRPNTEQIVAMNFREW